MIGVTLRFNYPWGDEDEENPIEIERMKFISALVN